MRMVAHLHLDLRGAGVASETRGGNGQRLAHDDAVRHLLERLGAFLHHDLQTVFASLGGARDGAGQRRLGARTGRGAERLGGGHGPLLGSGERDRAVDRSGAVAGQGHVHRRLVAGGGVAQPLAGDVP